MLEQLLKQIAGGGIHSLGHMAHELGVSEGLVEQMLGDLERMGYLRRLDTTCECSHCGDCDVSPTCAIHGTGQVWTLTDKKLPF